MTPPARRSLVHHHDFRQLWIGDSISQAGTQVSVIALPYVAVTTLAATELEMGVLTAFEFLAFLVVGLPAGAWVDRWQRQRVLIVNDLIRAVALASLPVAYLLHVLTLGQMFVVALVTGTCTVFFDVAYQSYLPALVHREQITEGNSKLEVSRSVAQVAGPGVGGVLLRLVGGPLVLLINAVTYVLSALFIRRITHTEPPHDRASRRPMRVEIAEGLTFVVRHRLLRRMVATTGLSNLFTAVYSAVIVLYLVRDLDFGPGTIGLVFSAGSVGGILGALAADPLSRLVGQGRIIPLAAVFGAPFVALTPLASFGPAIPLLILGGFGSSFAVVVYNVNQVSFRQRMCPPALLGRMNASVRFLVWGTLPIGSLAGGVLAHQTSVLTTLWVASAGVALAGLPTLLSPLATMRTLPVDLDAHADPAELTSAPTTVSS